MSKQTAYEAPSVTELGSVHELTMTLKKKKLAFSIDFVERKNVTLVIPFTTDR